MPFTDLTMIANPALTIMVGIAKMQDAHLQTDSQSLLAPQVREVDTAELLEGRWQENCAMLCMPGGADLPYCRRLNGKGNALIKGGALCPTARSSLSKIT